MRELTIRGILLGGAITLLFTAANVYLGLRVGLTFATSIPAAVISMAILRFFATSSILENNIVQTVASAAGTLAAIIFVLPGLVIVGWWQGFPFWTTALVCALGGTLGVMFSIPLRRALVVDSPLPYPEGVAAAEVLKVGAASREGAAESRAGLRTIVRASVASALFATLTGMRLALAEVAYYFKAGAAATGIAGGLSMALVPNPRDTAGLLRTIRRERPSFLCAVPTLLTALMSHPDVARTRPAFRAIKLCFSGGSPLLTETKRSFEALTGGVVMEGYSLTEAQMAAIANPAAGPKKPGSVGMPLPDVDVRLVDVETGTRDVAQGEPGEVLISAPQLMQGYWQQADETAAVLEPDEAGRRWLRTGDVGYLDDDGYLFLTDRKKELIKVSGYQVWPREIEEAVAAHPAVLEAGVAALPHATKGERPKAWVVLRPGAHATGDELRAFCRERLAAYKVPAEVSVVPELPKSAVGKVLRRKLRELDDRTADA